MKKYIKGWTMAELVVAMIVLAILMLLSIQAIRPKKIKTLPFAYAAVKNLADAAGYVLEQKGGSSLPDGPVDYPAVDSNETCVDLAESMSLLGDYTCVKTANCKPAKGRGKTGKPNFQTSNLIAYYGLEKDFTSSFRGVATDTAKCATAAVGMKDIMFDIDGDDGPNEIGKDQFPMKLLATGEVIPGTCANIAPGATPTDCDGETFDNPTFSRHPDCGTDTTMYINEKEPFAYTVYKSRPATQAEIDTGSYDESSRITEVLVVDDETKAEISFAEADCIARNNVLTRTQCAKLGYKPVDKCMEEGSYCIVLQSKPFSMNLFALPY